MTCHYRALLSHPINHGPHIGVCIQTRLVLGAVHTTGGGTTEEEMVKQDGNMTTTHVDDAHGYATNFFTSISGQDLNSEF